MPRRTRRLAPQALAIVALVAIAWLAACQDYNFSPVRYCLIQPGTERVTLSDISTADILFVVDDSGSMGGEQKKLAASFDAFVTSLQASNVARVASRLEPIDFHIAVTTTSVFQNKQPATQVTCTAACGGAGGQQVCCRADTNGPLRKARPCATAADCTPGNQCLETCRDHGGEKACCAAAGNPAEEVAVTCAEPGASCGLILDRYEVPRAVRTCGVAIPGGGGAVTSCARGPNLEVPNPAPGGYSCRNDCPGMAPNAGCCADAAPHANWLDDTCQLGLATEGGLYPAGDFVRKGTNPRVLHFDKSLFCARATNPADGKEACACTLPGGPASCDPAPGAAATIATLVSQFKENVAVGTCGSPQEQGLEAAKLALQKALGLNGLSQPAEAGGAAPEWPHPRRVVASPERPSSKLVVVFVGDEDDCSSPRDASGGIILTGGTSGNPDSCELDVQQRRYPVQAYADFLGSLGRPVAGAFIVSVTTESCQDGECVPGYCCDTQCTGDVNVCSLDGLCGGQGRAYRFKELSTKLPGKSADTVMGSVCNPGAAGSPGFSSILARVAEVVKQPAGLLLPTQPAAAQLTLLRIAGPDGKTRKTCVGPAAAGTTGAALDGYDWWFTGGDDTDRTPTGPSKFIYLNRTTRNCEANPGETYSADYLGLVPAAGCLTQADCQAALGGVLEDWTCDTSQGGARGTCLCGAP